LFSSLSFVAGLSLLFGFTLIFHDHMLGHAAVDTSALQIPPIALVSGRILRFILCALALLWAFSPQVFLRKIIPPRIASWIPTTWQRCAGIGLAIIDWLLAAVVLVLLMPGVIEHGAFKVLGAFVIAQGAGIASHVPGGVGVFEATFLSLVYAKHAPPVALSAIIAYRLVYYLLPFALGVALLLAIEVRRYARARSIIGDTSTFNIWCLPYASSKALVVTRYFITHCD